MSRAGTGALEQALAYTASPGLLPGARAAGLPDDVLVLLRLAAGDEECLSRESARLHQPARKLHDAAVFYIQQVLFAPGADSYRVLGARADIADARLREHYRWLVRWLHPDRNVNDWEAVYLDRVNQAWRQLRSPERRRVHDLALYESVQSPRPPTSAAAADVEPRPRALSPTRKKKRRRGSSGYGAWPVLGLAAAGLAAVVLILGGEPDMSDEGVVVSAQASGGESSRPQLAAERTALLPPRVDASSTSVPMAPEIDASLPVAAQPRAEPEPETVPVITGSPAAAPLMVARLPTAAPLRVDRRVTTTASLAEVSPPQAQPTVSPTRPPVLAKVAPEVVAEPVWSTPQLPVASAALPAMAPATPAVPEAMSANARPERPIASGVAPVSVTGVEAVSSGSSAPVTAINDRVAFSFMQKFRRAYNDGNLEQLMALFARDARSAGGGGRQAIADSFRRQFDVAGRARITLGRPDWQRQEQGAVISAGYRLSGDDQPASEGRMRFELRQEAGELRILRLQPEKL